MVNRHDGVLVRRDLNRGNPIFGPLRVPFLESFQLPSARASASRPVLYASLEFSAHHGATWSFARFHALRNAGSVQEMAGVSSSAAIP